MIASGTKKNTPAPNNVVSIFTSWPLAAGRWCPT
jgi:hypothetical protein